MVMFSKQVLELCGLEKVAYLKLSQRIMESKPRNGTSILNASSCLLESFDSLTYRIKYDFF